MVCQSYSYHLANADGYLVAPKLGLPVNTAAVNSVTRGLVGDTSFAVLPNVTPKMTFALTAVCQLVSSPVPDRSIVRRLTP